ncbi:MAG: VIT1/CCC1 transporter family protein [Chloroflexota bacterium]|nr:VIT1/CCC1 transporter family protein [Chloroflexota bacterium]
MTQTREELARPSARPARAQPRHAASFDREWLRQHLATERRQSSLLGEIREVIFGAQDGLVSTLAVVSTVGGATFDRFPILIAGIASALAGVFSMAAGEFMSSKSQREIFDAQIVDEREEVRERPGEAEAEIAYMFEEDGLPRDVATRVASSLANHPEVLLKTMVEKELGLRVEDHTGSPFQGALVMGAAFGAGALVPVLPYVFLPVRYGAYASVLATALVLFGLGVVKARWTRRNPFVSGLEILALGAFAGIAGYFFGSILPALLGAPPVG